MDQTYAMNLKNYPGQHIEEDLQQIEFEYQQPRQNPNTKYSKFFLIFQSIIVFISILVISIGNSKQLGCPFDSNGNICGESLGLEQYKYIYFSNPVNDKSLYLTVCVKECPIQDNENEVDELQCMPNQLIKTCKNNQLIEDNEFNLIYYDSLKFINVCMPTKPNYLKNVLIGLESFKILIFFQDLKNGVLIILCTYLFSTLINQILYLLLIKLQQKTIWIIQVTLILVLFLLTCINYYYFEIQFQQVNQNPKLTLLEVVSIVQIYNSNFKIIFLPIILSLFFAILAIYYFLDLIQNFKKYQTIGLKITITNYFYDYPSKILLNDKQSIFKHFYLIPIAFGVIIAVIFFVWVLIALSIFTIGNVTTHRYPFNTFQLNLFGYIFGIIHILDLFLILLVISGISKFLMIGIILEQYSLFVKQRYNNQKFNEKQSIKNILYYCIINKLGVIFLSQILITLLKIPRMIIKIYLWITLLYNPNYQVSNLTQNILSINERAQLLSFIRIESFLTNAKCQYLFDKKLMENTQIQQHGQFFTNSYCLAISSLCLLFTYFLLIMTRTTIIIQDPINFLLFSFISSYFVTKFYSQIYGITIDNLTILLYRDVAVDGKVVGNSVRKSIRLIKEPLINLEE